MCQFPVSVLGIGCEVRFEDRFIAVFETVGQCVLQGSTVSGVHVGVRHPDGEGAGSFPNGFHASANTSSLVSSASFAAERLRHNIR